MSKKYASKYWTGYFSWWDTGEATFDNETKYLISEKYRFIKDLIAIL